MEARTLSSHLTKLVASNICYEVWKRQAENSICQRDCHRCCLMSVGQFLTFLYHTSMDRLPVSHQKTRNDERTGHNQYLSKIQQNEKYSFKSGTMPSRKMLPVSIEEVVLIHHPTRVISEHCSTTSKRTDHQNVLK